MSFKEVRPPTAKVSQDRLEKINLHLGTGRFIKQNPSFWVWIGSSTVSIIEATGI